MVIIDRRALYNSPPLQRGILVRNYMEDYIKVVAPAQPAIIFHKRPLFNILLLQPPLVLTAKLESEPWLCPVFPYTQLPNQSRK
jgi:hypothetical protein